MVLIGKINSAVSAIPAIGFLLTKLNSSAIITLVLLSWGRSSAGRAFDWQSRGHGFDPHRLHQVHIGTAKHLLSLDKRCFVYFQNKFLVFCFMHTEAKNGIYS